MIKNIIFDLGRVLVDFYPIEHLKKMKYDDDKVKLLNKIIFNNPLWQEFDRGGIPDSKTLAVKICEEYPEHSDDINRVLSSDWITIHYLRDYTFDYLKEMKSKGYKIYILSNLSKESYEYVSRYDLFGTVDGAVFSYEVGVCKPDKGIYEALIEKYNIIPDESVFIDDLENNIKTAEKLGIHGVQYKTLEEVKKQVELLL